MVFEAFFTKWLGAWYFVEIVPEFTFTFPFHEYIHRMYGDNILWLSFLYLLKLGRVNVKYMQLDIRILRMDRGYLPSANVATYEKYFLHAMFFERFNSRAYRLAASSVASVMVRSERLFMEK